jgi:FkbM family methyltransferase
MRWLANTLGAWRRGSLASGFRSRIIAFLCARYGNLSRERTLLRMAIHWLIGRFGAGDQVVVPVRCFDREFKACLRRGNASDYLVFGEIVMGAYPLWDHPIKHPDHVIDGGTNIGLFSLLAHAAFPKASLTCYEPDPANVAQIRRNFDVNGVRARVLQMGMWSSTQELFFHSAMSYSGTVSAEASGIRISCELPEIPANCLLKLDIEGAEHEVLPALFAAGRFPYSILMEIHEFDSRGGALLDLLRKNSYRWEGSFSFSEPCVNVFAFRE